MAIGGRCSPQRSFWRQFHLDSLQKPKKMKYRATLCEIAS
jgi:hypothetical protein